VDRDAQLGVFAGLGVAALTYAARREIPKRRRDAMPDPFGAGFVATLVVWALTYKRG